ncbi:MAG: FmdB family zinc ribbon protein [Collimonas sp.]|uniref:FmdB family zinc ribbon protein n=1 Tax=Collimonas sp. TaxID=1963772 RepID=UPI003264C6E0
MPIYAYRCEACGFAKDVLQKMSDEPLTVCPSCSKAAFKKQVTAAGFQLKGTGWYVTDFRGGAGATAPPAAAAEAASPAGTAVTAPAATATSASAAPAANSMTPAPELLPAPAAAIPAARQRQHKVIT